VSERPLPPMPLLISRKKQGGALTEAEIRGICKGFIDGSIPDYQVAAWLMAVCWRGMTSAETEALTAALVESGSSLEWGRDRPVVDKHSTGGVGDKTSIVLVPLLAAAGLVFVKMSGRGLALTGGTLDKLESIPGFRVEMPISRIRSQVERIGCALVGQTPELVPADAALYALRDVTATVDSVPLIASSVMSKKLAAGAHGIILDVKYGAGAHLGPIEEARALARTMVGIGRAGGRRVRALLSGNDEPLGMTVGNALEVSEAIEVLRGGGPADLRELVVELGAQLMELAGVTVDLDDARRALGILLDGGLGSDKLESLIEAQGGDPGVVTEPSRLPTAPCVELLSADRPGWVSRVDARGIAEAALHVGAGRKVKGAVVDPRTGVRLLRRSGDRVEAGDPLAELHHAESGSASAMQCLRAAYRIVDEPVTPLRTTHEVVDG
jgi:pyrimidine-nucleoside phosphorylase